MASTVTIAWIAIVTAVDGLIVVSVVVVTASVVDGLIVVSVVVVTVGVIDSWVVGSIKKNSNNIL